MYLVDTDVVSGLTKRRWKPVIETWITKQKPEALFVSVITIGEIERGVSQQQRHNKEFALQLGAWLEGLLAVFGTRVLPFDLPASRLWGQLSGRLGHRGTYLQIAATALERGLTVATRNVSHFLPAGVAVIDPFDPAHH